MSGLYLLIDEPPIQVSPTLASILGLNEAIALQQLHYWLVHNKRDSGKQKTHCRDGKWWAFNTYSEWQSNNFPFWSVPTVKRVFNSLEKLKVDGKSYKLVLSEQFNKTSGDCTKWYTIDYQVLKGLINPSDQIDPTPLGSATPGIKLIPPSDQIDPTPGINLIPSYIGTETTNRDYTETTLIPPTPHGGNAREQNQNPVEGGWKTWEEVLEEKEEDLPRLALEYTEQPAPQINSSALAPVKPSEGLEEKPVPAAARRKKTSTPKHYPLDFDQWWVKYREFCYQVDAEPGDRKPAARQWDKLIIDVQTLNELWEGFDWYVLAKKGELGRKGQAIGVPHGCRFLSNEKWLEALEHKRIKQSKPAASGISATPQQQQSFDKFMTVANIVNSGLSA